MAKPRINSKELAKRLNEFRIAHQEQSFLPEQLKKLLVEDKILSMSALKKIWGHLKKVNLEEGTFGGNTIVLQFKRIPISQDMLENVLDIARKKANGYNKPTQEELVEKAIELLERNGFTILNDKEEDVEGFCIEYLLQSGDFRIQKKVTKWEDL